MPAPNEAKTRRELTDPAQSGPLLDVRGFVPIHLGTRKYRHDSVQPAQRAGWQISSPHWLTDPNTRQVKREESEGD